MVQFKSVVTKRMGNWKLFTLRLLEPGHLEEDCPITAISENKRLSISVAPENFPFERHKKFVFHLLPNRIFRKRFIIGKQPLLHLLFPVLARVTLALILTN